MAISSSSFLSILLLFSAGCFSTIAQAAEQYK